MEESIKIPSLMKEALLLEPVDICSYSPLALAYMGDAVYEVLVRTRVMNRGSMQVNKMHKKSASLVKAEAQARIIQALQEELTEEEIGAFANVLGERAQQEGCEAAFRLARDKLRLPKMRLSGTTEWLRDLRLWLDICI